ncbi:TfoX/Sxy family protein [Microvirga flavescens]|uniref:TfoX/Sxy family protein n=1 Tax=Microvirga flavescens TaxID=2249811 RepID=UPI001FE07539|nr:TfoX/Sxy family protein [Microvirga flavescens]
MDADDIRDVFSGFGPVRIRKMFGGQGIYRDDLMFALEADGELYLKTDAESEAMFRIHDSRPFAYTTRDGRTTVMSYWLLPSFALDDLDEAARFAHAAFAAAQRAKMPKPKAHAPKRKRA